VLNTEAMADRRFQAAHDTTANGLCAFRLSDMPGEWPEDRREAVAARLALKETPPPNRPDRHVTKFAQAPETLSEIAAGKPGLYKFIEVPWIFRLLRLPLPSE